MAFVVLYDANVLYPSTLRDLLIRIAQAGLVQAKWTDQILDEVFRNILDNVRLLSTQRGTPANHVHAPTGASARSLPFTHARANVISRQDVLARGDTRSRVTARRFPARSQCIPPERPA